MDTYGISVSYCTCAVCISQGGVAICTALPVRHAVHVQCISYREGGVYMHKPTMYLDAPYIYRYIYIQVHYRNPPCEILHTRIPWESHDSGPGVYSITIQTQWDSVHTGPRHLISAAAGRDCSPRPGSVVSSCPNPCEIRRLPLGCHCNPGVNGQF